MAVWRCVKGHHDPCDMYDYERGVNDREQCFQTMPDDHDKCLGAQSCGTSFSRYPEVWAEKEREREREKVADGRFGARGAL